MPTSSVLFRRLAVPPGLGGRPVACRRRRIPGRHRLPLLVFAACTAVYLTWWAAFYPGLMSFDSVTYVWQVTSGHWRADHSVLYDALVWLSLKATGDLAALTLLQAVGSAALLAGLATALRDVGVPGRWAACAAVAVAVLPATGTFVVTVWKDVPFALCALAATTTLVRLASTAFRGRLPVALGLELLGLCLFRNNGFLAAAIAVVAAVIVLRWGRLWTLLAGAVPIAVSFTLSGWVYPALGIEGIRPSLTYATAYADIAVVYAERPTLFHRADLTLMREVAPLQHWRTTATCYNSDPTTGPGFDGGKADLLNDRLLRLWAQIFERAPDAVLGARLCRGSIAWVVFPGQPEERAQPGPASVPDDLFGWQQAGQTMDRSPYRPILKIRPLSGRLHDAAAFLRGITYTPQLEWMSWRGATWCYLAYLAVVALAWVRRRRALLAAAAMVAGLQLGMLAAVPWQLFRYMAAPILIGIMLVPLLPLALRERRLRSGGG